MDGDEATLDKDDIRDGNFRLTEPERARTRSLVIDDPEPISVTSEELSGIYYTQRPQDWLNLIMCIQAIGSFVLLCKKSLAWLKPAAMGKAGRVWLVTVLMPEAAVP